MGMVRHDEAVEADKTLGLDPEDLIFLGYPDFRTLNIWYAHWGNAVPMKSMLTRTRSVPYKDAYRPGALYKSDEILILTTGLSIFFPELPYGTCKT